MYTNSIKSEAQKYAESIAEDIRNLYKAEYTEEEAEALREDGEPADLYDYASEALDVEYLLDSQKALIGVNLYVTLGGPTCWVDTRANKVRCTWGGESGEAYIPGDAADIIADCFRETWDC